MTKKQTADFNWNAPRIAVSLTEGKDAEALYEAIQKDSASFREGSLGFLDYDPETSSIRGSNVPRIGQMNKAAHDLFGIRMAVPTDDIYRTIFPIIQGKHYTDLNALDVRDKKPSRTENTGLWKKLIGLAEEELKGDFKFPFRVQGFYTIPDADSALGYSIALASDHRFIQDEGLDLPSGTRFNSLNEKGIVVPDENGRFVFYRIDNGVSRVVLDSDGNLDSDDDSLAYSNEDGRGALVSDAEGVFGERATK